MRAWVVPTSKVGLCEVTTDGKTVWVCSERGDTLGRFGLRGVDLHAPSQQQEDGVLCLDCTHTKPSVDDWVRFCNGIYAAYGVLMPEDSIPAWLRNFEAEVSFVDGSVRIQAVPDSAENREFLLKWAQSSFGALAAVMFADGDSGARITFRVLRARVASDKPRRWGDQGKF